MKGNIRQKTEDKLQTELHLKNKELSSAALAASQKNDILLEIDKRVLKIEEYRNIENSENLRVIKQLVKRTLTSTVKK